MYYYSAKTCGFYVSEIHGKNMPSDVVEVDNATHDALMNDQSKGRLITADAEGRPISVDPSMKAD